MSFFIHVLLERTAVIGVHQRFKSHIFSQKSPDNVVNKIRVLKSPDSVTAFAIGTHVHRLTMPAANAAKE